MPAQAIQDRDMAGQTKTQRIAALWFTLDHLERVVRENGRASMAQHNRERARMVYPHNKLEFDGGLSDEEQNALLERCHDRVDQIVNKKLPDLSKPKAVTRPRTAAKPKTTTKRRASRGRNSRLKEPPDHSEGRKEIFTIPEAAEYLGVSQNQIRSLDQSGSLRRMLHPGRRVLFTRKELDRFRGYSD